MTVAGFILIVLLLALLAPLVAMLLVFAGLFVVLCGLIALFPVLLMTPPIVWGTIAVAVYAVVALTCWLSPRPKTRPFEYWDGQRYVKHPTLTMPD